MAEDSLRFGPLQIGIIVLTLITAVTHLAMGLVMFNQPDPLFTLNGIGYLVLLALLYIPTPALDKKRSLIRWALMGYTAITVFAWVFVGVRTPMAYLVKLMEVGLIVLLWLEGQQRTK